MPKTPEKRGRGRPKSVKSSDVKKRATFMLSPTTINGLEEYAQLVNAKSRSAAADDLLEFAVTTLVPTVKKMKDMVDSGPEGLELLDKAFNGIDPDAMINSMLDNPKLMLSATHVLANLFDAEPKQQDLFNG